LLDYSTVQGSLLESISLLWYEIIAGKKRMPFEIWLYPTER